jgi:hypothetical protein
MKSPQRGGESPIFPVDLIRNSPTIRYERKKTLHPHY